MKKYFAMVVLFLSLIASAFASQKPTVTDWREVPGGPFTRVGVAPYNFYFSPSTVSKEENLAGVAVEAVPTDGTPIRYSLYVFDCLANQYRYETYDRSTDTWSQSSEARDIVPNTANAYLKPLVCQ